MKKITILILVSLTMGSLMFVSCSSLGTRSSKNKKESFKTSHQYNVEKGKFENRIPELVRQEQKNMDYWEMIGQWRKKGVDRTPSNPLPQVKPNIDEFLLPSEKLKVIWFGHSTLLLNVEGKIVLVDPVFSNNASPVGFLVGRFQKPALELNELPAIDYILISHDHYDHLDMETVKFFKNKDTKFITPLGVGTHITGWGIEQDRIIEKDWWEEVSFEGIKFIATPAQHFSGRKGFDNNETLWASWVIQSKHNNIYFSGDTGYDTHFKDIGNKFGPFDIAFIESGQYNERWQTVHMLPNESVMAYKDLKAKKYFPIHWGMFELSLHSWYEPIEYLYGKYAESKIDLVSPKLGQIIDLSNANFNGKWWSSSVKAVKFEKLPQPL